jgi:hypothetical protein
MIISIGCSDEKSSTLSRSGSDLSHSLLSSENSASQIQAFVHAQIIDGTGNSFKDNQTLLIENGVIMAVGSDEEIIIPKRAVVYDATGKSIIPGIVGMHNHLHIPGFPDVGEVAAKLYLASGVTTIQTCGAASPDNELELSKLIVSGKQVGPEIIPSAPFITGPNGNPNMIIPRDEQHLRDTLAYWIDREVKWFKVYRHTQPATLKTVLEVAHDNGAKVRGHVCTTTFEEAAEMGIDGLEHGLNSASDFRINKDYGLCNGGRNYMDELVIDGKEVKAVQQIMIDNQVFLTSTLSIFEASIPNRAFADERSLNIMSPLLKQQYQESRIRNDQDLTDSTRNRRLKRIMEFEYQFVKMGGLLCSGVDAGRHVLPGFGDQQNFILLKEAGFSTEEAIQIMTSNGAKALDRLDIGSLQSGKRADFVILDGFLVKDDNVIKKVDKVFKAGTEYDPAEILRGIQGQFGVD